MKGVRPRRCAAPEFLSENLAGVSFVGHVVHRVEGPPAFYLCPMPGCRFNSAGPS